MLIFNVLSITDDENCDALGLHPDDLVSDWRYPKYRRRICSAKLRARPLLRRCSCPPPVYPARRTSPSLPIASASAASLRLTDPRASRPEPQLVSTVGTTREHERLNGNKALFANDDAFAESEENCFAVFESAPRMLL
jgi:hypothetical protein